METKAEGQVWTPALQDFQPSTMTFYIRTATAPEKMAPLARRTVAQIDPEVPLYNVKTMQAQINETHFIDRLLSMLSAAFGVPATLLAVEQIREAIQKFSGSSVQGLVRTDKPFPLS